MRIWQKKTVYRENKKYPILRVIKFSHSTGLVWDTHYPLYRIPHTPHPTTYTTIPGNIPPHNGTESSAGDIVLLYMQMWNLPYRLEYSIDCIEEYSFPALPMGPLLKLNGDKNVLALTCNTHTLHDITPYPALYFFFLFNGNP